MVIYMILLQNQGIIGQRYFKACAGKCVQVNHLGFGGTIVQKR